MTGYIYQTHAEIQQGPKTLRKVLRVALSRPWVMLIREPIVTVLSIYQAIIYATLYLCFGKTVCYCDHRFKVAKGGFQLPFRLYTKKNEVGRQESEGLRSWA